MSTATLEARDDAILREIATDLSQLAPASGTCADVPDFVDRTAPTEIAIDEPCCPPAEQASCCEPSAKAACCGESVVGGCGCR